MIWNRERNTSALVTIFFIERFARKMWYVCVPLASSLKRKCGTNMYHCPSRGTMSQAFMFWKSTYLWNGAKHSTHRGTWHFLHTYMVRTCFFATEHHLQRLRVAHLSVWWSLPRNLISSGTPTIVWAVGVPLFLFLCTVAAKLLCLKTWQLISCLPSDSRNHKWSHGKQKIVERHWQRQCHTSGKSFGATTF